MKNIMIGLSSLQTNSRDQHISGVDNRIGKFPEINYLVVKLPAPT